MKKKNRYCVIGRYLKKNLYPIPCESSNLGIFEVGELSLNLNCWSIFDIVQKLFLCKKSKFLKCLQHFQ